MFNKKKIILAIVLIIAITVSFMGGQTYSKYISNVNGIGISETAKWYFKVNGGEALMQNINLMQTCDESTLTNGKLAPGTKGYFDIIIDTTGAEVGVEYKVNFKNEQNKPNNLMFKYNDTTYATLDELENLLQGTVEANSQNKTVDLLIEWIWNYETGENANEIKINDQEDTDAGLQYINYSFDVFVTGTQVVPGVM